MENQDQSQLSLVIQQAVNEENLFKKLRMTHIILHSLNLDKEPKKFHNLINQLIQNEDFMRKLLKNAKVKENPVTAIEYLGRDYLGGDPNYNYDVDFENYLNELNEQIDEYLGKALAAMTKLEEEISLGIG